jgi:hypothetical protein
MGGASGLGTCAGVLLTGFLFVRYFGVIGEQPPHSWMLVFLFLTGLISLGYEKLWVRILSTCGLSTSQAFALRC